MARKVFGRDANATMQAILAESKKGLAAHKKSLDSAVGTANKAFETRSLAGKSVKNAKENYKKIIETKKQLVTTQKRMNKMTDDMSSFKTNMRTTKREITGIVEMFLDDTKTTGRDITQLQDNIQQYVADNSKQVLGMIQDEREFYYNSLGSVKTRRGIVTAMNKFKIPLNRGVTLFSTLVSASVGWYVGKKI